MICTLSDSQQKKLYIAIVKQLESSTAPFDVKGYIKSIYDRIANNPKGGKDLALAYAAIIPGFILAAEGLNPDTIGEMLIDQHSDIHNLRKSFINNIQNVSDYVIEAPVDQTAIDIVIADEPSTGTNIPEIDSKRLKVTLENQNSAIPDTILATTGQDSIIKDGKLTGIVKPSMVRTMLVRKNIITEMTLRSINLGSELSYSFHKGFKLRLIKETQLPDNIADLGRPKNENYMVLAITDNDGEFLTFNKDGEIDKNGEVIHMSYRQPNEKTITTHNKFIDQTIQNLEATLLKENTPIEEIKSILTAERKTLNDKRDAEIIVSNEILTKYNNEYSKDLNKKLLIDIAGGSVGYLKEPGKNVETGVSELWTDTSTTKLTDEELRTMSYSVAGFTTIKINNVSKLSEVQGIPLSDKKFEEDVTKIVKILTTPTSENLTNKEKIDYLNTFIRTGSGRDKDIPTTIKIVKGALKLEVRGYLFNDLTKADPKQLFEALTNSGLYFNINSRHITASNYVDIKISETGEVTKDDTASYVDLLRKYTEIKAVPNIEGEFVELNGYFKLSYTPEQTKETIANEVKQSETLANQEEVDYEKIPWETNKLIELATTPSQQKAANLWWSNSPLSTIKVDGELLIPVERLTNIVNSNAFASWSLAGIKLNAGSDDTHLYHEAWHAFSQLFLTKEDKNKLYAETAKIKGTFKVVIRSLNENGDVVPKLVSMKFSKASKRQLEEYIAEEYRKFAIAKGDTKGLKGIMKTIFKKIWEFVKSLFDHVTVQDAAHDITLIKPLNDMFNALYVGNINNYAPSVENVFFSTANAGMLAVGSVDEEKTYTQSKLITESIDGLISKILADAGSNMTIRGLTNNNNKIKVYGLVKNALFKRYVELLKIKDNAKIPLSVEEDAILSANSALVTGKITPLPTSTLDEIQILNNNIDLLNWTIVNFGDIKESVNNFTPKKTTGKGVVSYHLINSTFNDLLRISVKDDEIDVDNADSKVLATTERYGDKGPNSSNPFDDADNQVVYLIKSLLKQDNLRNFELNSLGFPMLVDFTVTKNSMERKIFGSPSPSILYNKIVKLSKKDVLYEQLASRLGVPGLGNLEQDRLWFKFTETCSKFIQPLITLIVENETKTDEKGVIKSKTIKTKTGRAYSDITKVKNNWLSNFKMATPKEENFILQNIDNNNYLNLSEIVDKFLIEEIKVANKKKYISYRIKGDTTNALLFLNAIGLDITLTGTTLNEINTKEFNTTLKYIGSNIGYLNNVKEMGQGELQITNPVEYFARDQKGLQKVINEKGEITYISVKAGGQSGFINSLARIEADNSDKYSSTNKLNAEGERQSELAKGATNSKRIYALQEATNKNDFHNTDGYFAYMSYLNERNNPAAKSSIILNSLFNKGNGSRTGVTIELKNLAGTVNIETDGNTRNEDGLSHASMTISDKLISDYTMLLTDGTIAHPTTGGKSTHYATKLSNLTTYPGKLQNYLYIDTAEFITNDQGEYGGFDKAFDIILPKIQSELEKILKFNANKSIYDNYKAFSEKTTGDFAIFDDILEDSTKEKLKKLTSEALSKGLYPYNPTTEQLAIYNDNKNVTLLSILNKTAEGIELKNKIKTELKHYFDTLYTETKNLLADQYGYTSQQIRDEIVTNMKGDKLDINNPADIAKIDEAALKSFVYNNWINNVEITFLHNGDITIYNHSKDEATKRYPLFQSSGSMFPTDDVSKNMINKLGTPLTKLVTGKDDFYDGTMNTAVIVDYEQKRDKVYNNIHDLLKRNFEKKGLQGSVLEKALTSAMKPYLKQTVTDGQAYITFDAYRTLKNLEGKWAPEQEDLYQRIVKGEKPSLEETIEFFPVYKLQYAGNLKTDEGLLPVTAGHKFALFPLIPNVIEDTPLEELHIEMMKQGVHYVTHDSGSKLASITNNKDKKNDTIFDKQTGHYIPGVTLTKNTIFVEYLKNQTEVNSQFKGKSTMSTQLRTLLSTGLIENGIPVNFKKGEDNRLEKWNGLTEDQKMENQFYKLVRTYEKRVNRLVDLKKEELISNLGWYKNEQGSYEGPISSVIDYIKEELKNQGLTEHELVYIQYDGLGDLVRDLSGSPIADTIEKSLMAHIDKKIRRQVVNGEPLVEVSVANTLQFKNINTAIERYGNTDLEFYTADIDGILNTTSCQVKIALQGSFENLFQLNDNEGVTIAQYDLIEETVNEEVRTRRVLNAEKSRVRLNQLIKDPAWLDKDNNRKKIRLTGVRIPVQGLNSMEFMEVAEFLPPQAGNIIILPAEIVAKSGTDFDVDKLTTYMPTIGKTGKWLFDEYTSREELDTEISKAENRLNDLLKNKNVTGKNVDALIKDYNSTKKDKGASIIALKLQRDKLKNEIVTGIADIKAFLRDSNAENILTGRLHDLMTTSDDKIATDIITSFTNRPAKLSGTVIIKTYDTIIQNSLELNKLKKTLKEGYDDQTDYLKENPEINKANIEYQELKNQKRNFIKAIENSLINDIINILELPENAVRLLTANDTNKTKPYADEMESFVQEQNFKKSKRIKGTDVEKGISPTRLMEYPYLLKKHEAAFVSKEALGIAAKANKGNSIYNNAGAYIPSTVPFIVKKGREDVEEMVPTKIYLKTNKIDVIENGEMTSVISLSNLKDANNENEIAEIISQLMNGYVDAEKDAWIAFIQGNKEVTPVILFLLEAGVPIKDIVYYVSNPLIRAYIQEFKTNKGILTKLRKPENKPEMAKSNAKQYVWEKLLGKKSNLPNMVKTAKDMEAMYGNTIFSTETLEKIAKSSLNDVIKNVDAIAGFRHYIYIEELTKNMNTPRNLTEFDTAKSATLFDIYAKQLAINDAYQNTRWPKEILDYILETSPLASFRLTEIAQDLFGPLFQVRNNEVLNNFLVDIITDFKKIKAVESRTGLSKDIFPTRFKNALMTYLFVNNLKSFSIGESSFYKGMQVKYINTGTKSVEMVNIKGLPVIQINENLLRREYKNQEFTKNAEGRNSYNEQGLSPVEPVIFYKEDNHSNILTGSKDYYNFVIEREYLRSIKPVTEFIKTHQFKSSYDRLTKGDRPVFNQRSAETLEGFEKRVTNRIYEDYLRNMALENSFNFTTMFFNYQQAGIASYATTLISLINKYPTLIEKYSILQQISASYYSDEADKIKNSYGKNLVNITLKDSNDLNPDSTAQYADDLVKLADSSISKTLIDTDEAREDNERLSSLFRKFPTYIFLQGGMNKNQFAFPSIFPADSAQSIIMNDAINSVNITKEMLEVVFEMFLINNNPNTKKLNQRQAASQYTLNRKLSAQLEDIKKESIISDKSEFDRLTPTSLEGIYTLDTKDLTDSIAKTLSSIYQGRAYFISNNPNFTDTSIKLRITDSGIIKLTPETLEKVKGGIDSDIDLMEDALESGVSLIFNEEGYGENILTYPDTLSAEEIQLHKDLFDYLTDQLFQRLGYTNTIIPVTTIKSVLTPSIKIINDEDIEYFTKYVKKAEGKLPTEFFTSKTVFKEFFNEATGKREKAPQSSKWILNSNKLYDLTDMDTGEVYITNVDLSTGYQQTTSAKISTQPTVSKGIEISSDTKGLGSALTNSTELAKSKGNLVQSYPVKFRDKIYRDAEEAYQDLKFTASKDEGPNSIYNLMVDIIKAKLEQHPRLDVEITNQGGSPWILSSTHQPTKQNNVWETGGKNWFIKALNEAYIKVNSSTDILSNPFDKSCQ